MNYAIVEMSGKQFWVEIGKFYNFNRIPCEVGKQIILNRVLLINDKGNIWIGQPLLPDARIEGKILKHLLDKKKIIYKMRSKKKTRCKRGHRQHLTQVLIEKITYIDYIKGV